VLLHAHVTALPLLLLMLTNDQPRLDWKAGLEPLAVCMQGRDSSDSGARSRSPAASQQLQADQQQDQHEQPEIARSIELTDEQTKAILRVSCSIASACSVALNARH
jgi:hypothetical protein